MNLFFREKLSLLFGSIIIILGSPVILMAAVATFWEYIDRKCKGTPGTGFLFQISSTINKKT